MRDVAYLEPQYKKDIIGLSLSNDRIKYHPCVQWYTLDEFIIAYNHGKISSNGHITAGFKPVTDPGFTPEMRDRLLNILRK